MRKERKNVLVPFYLMSFFFITLLIIHTLAANSVTKSYSGTVFHTPSLTLTPKMLTSSLLQSLSTPFLQGVLYQGFGNNKGTSYTTAPISSTPGYDQDLGQALSIQPDGKIVVGGNSTNGGTGASLYAVARFLTNGYLDPNFGQTNTPRAGTAFIPFTIIPGGHDGGGNPADQAYATTIQPNGKIILGGWATDTAGELRFALAQFTSNGILDTTFGTAKNGTTYIPFSIAGGTIVKDDEGRALALQPDGKILLAGSSIGDSVHYALARFLPNGSLDTTFGATKNGTAYTPFPIVPEGSDDKAYAIAIQPDGKILLGGSSAYGVDGGRALYRYSVARFLSDGTLDTSFGQVGTQRAGTACVDFAIVPGGDDDEAYGMGILPDGRIIVGGYSQYAILPGPTTVYHFSLACFLPNGTLDPNFGQSGTTRAGTAYIPFGIAGGTSDQAFGLSIQPPDGKILLGGFSIDQGGISRYSIARFLSNGTLDSTFGQTGTARAGTAYINFSIAGGDQDQINAIALQQSGNILAGGFSVGAGIVFSVAEFVTNDSLTYYQATNPGQGGFY